MTRPSDDSFWNGPPTHRLVPHGELSEWSCDAIGWLAEVIADCAAQLNVLAAEQL
jgi:Asp-tRNA(Asn)/Glu-tRNA(Gln) amidotransferase A subunit family amidase